MIKHSTATVYVLHRFDDSQWKVGLIEHPLWGKWVPAGGHVENDENAAEAALREASEETGLTGLRLLSPHSPEVPADFPPAGHEDYTGHVPLPWWIVEFDIPRDRSLPERHVHVDHQFVAVADDPRPTTKGAHPFGWYTAPELATISAFTDVIATGTHLLEQASRLVSARIPPVSPGVE
ncbi:NUDIX domain-containing protein [Phytomonospora sp. NPDC050363]|uniref:NUDIX domain-containing protein n=1 Tax=Phytomonospora sp. NPDC050363 TaxID=3155642 RepID=UPI0033DD37F1